MPRVRKSFFPLTDEQKQKLEAFEKRIAGDTEWIRSYCQRLQRDGGLTADAIVSALKEADISAAREDVVAWLGEDTGLSPSGRKSRKPRASA
jgi:hypothetical protein